MTFFHRIDYGRFEPVDNAIINLISIVIGLVFERVGRDKFRDRLKSALSGERFGDRRLR
jgi:hypothetical protein